MVVWLPHISILLQVFCSVYMFYVSEQCNETHTLHIFSFGSISLVRSTCAVSTRPSHLSSKIFKTLSDNVQVGYTEEKLISRCLFSPTDE